MVIDVLEEIIFEFDRADFFVPPDLVVDFTFVAGGNDAVDIREGANI